MDHQLAQWVFYLKSIRQLQQIQLMLHESHHYLLLIPQRQKIYLSINQLTGVIPNTFNNLTKLEELNLSINQLISTIPSNFHELVNLKYLNLSSNELYDSIPASLGYLNNLSELYLFRNNLSELIPRTVCNLIENECQISLYDNQLCPPYFECLADIVGAQDTSNCDQ